MRDTTLAAANLHNSNAQHKQRWLRTSWVPLSAADFIFATTSEFELFYIRRIEQLFHLSLTTNSVKHWQLGLALAIIFEPTPGPFHAGINVV
jgi:hypothetical protein